MSGAWEKELKLALDLARQAGDYLRGKFENHRSEIRSGLVSRGKDIKIAADREAEKIILDGLTSESDLSILTEESGEFGDPDPDGESPIWVIDPLDGTFNYSRGLPACCVSIALWRAGAPAFGVIYDFFSDEMYRGVPGEGAFLNDSPISVADTEDLGEAAIATGFPQNRDYSAETLGKTVEIVRLYKKIRMTGSGAISLAYLASGRVDVYMEEDIMFWDVAAGIALIQAAGGVTHMENSERMKWGRKVICAARSYPGVFPKS